MKSRFDSEKHNNERSQTICNSEQWKATVNPNIYKPTYPHNLYCNLSLYDLLNNYTSKKKKKSPPSEFKQSRMLLNFIDSSLQASAKQQAQITLVWKKTKNPQPFSGSVCNGLIKKPKSCWCGRLCWSRAVLCNSFVHLRTPSNLKWVLSYSTWDLLTVDHSNKWVGAGWQKLLAGVSLPLFFPFATRWSQWRNLKRKGRQEWLFMFIYFILKHQKKSKQSAKSVCNKLNFT